MTGPLRLELGTSRAEVSTGNSVIRDLTEKACAGYQLPMQATNYSGRLNTVLGNAKGVPPEVPCYSL